MNTHPSQTDLALLAGDECGVFARFTLRKHVRNCADCSERVGEFQAIRKLTADLPEPALNWASLAAEMRANIHLGLEAGECIRIVSPGRRSYIRLTAAFASLVLVVAAGFFMRHPVPVQAATVLESSHSGLEVRSQSGSLTLLNRHGAVTDQTVSAQGAIRARYIDADTGTVTINNVYLE